MNYLLNIIVVVVFILSIYFVVKKVIIPIINDIKNYRKMSEQEQDKFKILLIFKSSIKILSFIVSLYNSTIYYFLQ